VENSLTDGVFVRETMLIRHQMFDELVLARETSTWNAARTMMKVTMEAGGCGMNGSDMANQIAFASIMSQATMVRTVMAFMDDVKVEAWNRK
jgi:orotate phosphoribosyltransferase-like protein